MNKNVDKRDTIEIINKEQKLLWNIIIVFFTKIIIFLLILFIVVGLPIIISLHWLK